MSPKKTKLKLDTLKIKSFITDLDDRHQAMIKAGVQAVGWTHPPYCPSGRGGECPTGMEAGCDSYDYNCESKDTLCYTVCFSRGNNDPCEYKPKVTVVGGIIGL